MFFQEELFDSYLLYKRLYIKHLTI